MTSTLRSRWNMAAPPVWTPRRFHVRTNDPVRSWQSSSFAQMDFKQPKNKVAECEPVHQAPLRQFYFVTVIVPVARVRKFECPLGNHCLPSKIGRRAIATAI